MHPSHFPGGSPVTAAVLAGEFLLSFLGKGFGATSMLGNACEKQG